MWKKIFGFAMVMPMVLLIIITGSVLVYDCYKRGGFEGVFATLGMHIIFFGFLTVILLMAVKGYEMMTAKG